MPQTEIPTKVQGGVQLDRDVEGDWVLVDKKSALTPGPEKGIDNMMLESAGAAYLDEGEDFRGYSSKSSMEPEETKNAGNAIGAFFRRQKTNFE